MIFIFTWKLTVTLCRQLSEAVNARKELAEKLVTSPPCLSVSADFAQCLSMRRLTCLSFASEALNMILSSESPDSEDLND